MSIFGMILVDEKEFNKYKDETYKNTYAKGLKNEVNFLRKKIDLITKDPVQFFRGRKYSKKVITELKEVFDVMVK